MNQWLAAVIALLPFLVNAQTFNQREIDIPKGLRASDVKVLYTDNGGFVWIAAGQSLFWHDGNVFREIKISDSLPDKEISSLYQDNTGQYWIGWNSGEIHVMKKGDPSLYRPEEGTPAVAIVKWAEDSQQQLWMCTKGEGVYVKDKSGRWFNFNIDEGFPSNETYDIIPLLKGVAVATDQGLAYCTFDNGSKTIEVFSKSSGLNDQIVKDLHYDKTGMLAAFYEPYLNLLTPSLKITDTIDAPVSDAKKVLRSAGIIWWLSEDGKLFQKNGNGAWVQLKIDLTGRTRINTFTEDQEGHLWVLGSRGIFMIDQWYSHIETDQSVTAVATSEEAVWYAQQGELYRYDMATNTTKKVWHGSNLILSLYRDDWGNIWCGTFDGGLLRYEPNSATMKTFKEKSGLANNNVLSISGSSAGLWVGTLGGVSQIIFGSGGSIKEIKSYDKDQGVSVQYIYSVHVNKAGKVYIGTDGQGVLTWNGKRFEPLSGKKQDHVVLDVSSDKKGNVWWVTSEGVLEGLSSNGQKLKVPPYPEEPGKVAGIETLDDGSILVMHDGGVHRWFPNFNNWVAYKKSFGLGVIQPQLNAHATSSGNMIYIGTSNGISSLSIDHLPLKSEPKTFLYSFQLFQEPTSNQSFSSSENYFTFQYVGRWYTEPSEVRYKLLLKGFDPNWIESKNTEISYPRLPPGNYTFEVVAGVDGNYPDKEVESISFTVRSAWYVRWYSILIGIFLLGGLLIFLFRIRIKTIEQKQEREKQQVQAQLETLKSQVNPHFLFNSFNTLMSLIEEDRDGATDYLADLSDFFRYILEFRDVDLISVKEDVRIVQTYLQLQAKRFGKNLITQIELSDEVLSSFIPPLTLQLLAENAFKHNVISKEKPLELSIKYSENRIVISNRHWMKPKSDESTGYGLDSIKKKYKYYNAGAVKVEVSVDHFAVSLPVIYQIKKL